MATIDIAVDRTARRCSPTRCSPGGYTEPVALLQLLHRTPSQKWTAPGFAGLNACAEDRPHRHRTAEARGVLNGSEHITDVETLVRFIQTSLTLAFLVMVVSGASWAQTSQEARTAAYFRTIASSPPQLRIFLQAMPKGGDLHNHLGGSIYVEDFLRWAGDGGMCLSVDTNRIVLPPCDGIKNTPIKGLATSDYSRYSHAVDAMSMRGFERGVNDPTLPGFDRFFTAYDKFLGASPGNVDKELAAERETAAYSNVSYLEIMVGVRSLKSLYATVDAEFNMRADIASLKKLEPLIPNAVADARAEYNDYEAKAANILGCDSPNPKPGCNITVRYQSYALRNQSPGRVFAALALGFALVEADPRFVTVNIVAPEHDPVALRDYDLHMRMIAFFKSLHPNVPLAMHAGELTLGLVPPRELRSHIHDAVVIAGAKRIGHGVDISYEEDATETLRRMARDKIDVEINLTSNATILGVKGKDHPLALYRRAGVPVTLSTDDLGVSRSDMTNEYVRAVNEQGLDYKALKQIARNSLEYAFLRGPSLWQANFPVGEKVVSPCSTSGLTSSVPCKSFLEVSPKAMEQWKLEQDLHTFEGRYH